MAQSFRTAISFNGLASASSQALAVKVDGDSENRILVDAGGKITWGAGGSSAGDTTLYRNAANVLKTDDGFVAASVTVPDGGLTLGSTAVTSTAAELNILDGVTSTTSELNILDGVTSTASELNLVDGITAGTVSASKAVIADSSKDITGFRNITLTGELDAATLDISGDADIDGTTNLDAVDIDGAVQIDNTLTVGVDDTGYDVKLFGATSGKYMQWDESADALIVKDTVDAVNFKVNGGQGSDGQVLTSTGSGVAWEDASGGGGTPGGSNTQIQFNNSGNFGGNANLVYDGSALITMTKSGANTGIKLDVASDTEAHSGNIAFYKSEAAGAGRLDKDAVYGQIDYYGQTASNGYHHAASIKTLVGDYFYSDNFTPSDIEFWATPADQTSPVRKVVVRGGTSNTDAAALEIWHNQANKGSRVDFVDDDGTQLGYFGFSANANWYMKNLTSGNMFIESEGSIAIRAEGNYEVNFSSTGLEPYADEGYKLGSSSKEWSEAYIVDLKVSGNSTMAGTLTVGVDDTGHDVKFFGATSGKYMLWDESADALIVKDTVDAVNFKVNGGQGSDGQVLTSTGSGVAWEDASGGGGSPGGSDHQVQFNNNGSFGADANFTYDGSNLTAKVPFTVGVDDTGHDVKFFGAASGAHLLWDESNNRLDVVTSSGAAYFRSLNGTATTYIGSDSGNTALFGTSSAHDTRFITNDTERIRITSGGNVGIGASNPTSFFVVNGVSQFDGALNVGVNDTGHDVIFYGATADNAWFWWDESTDNLLLGPATKLGINESSPSTSLHVGGASTVTHSTGNYVLTGNNSNEQIKIVSDNNSGRPYIAFWNQDSGGTLDRKGYIGYPHAASDSSSIFIRSDQGLIDMSETTMTKLTLTDTTDTGGDTSDGALRIGASSGQHLAFDTNEIISKSDDSTMGDLHLQTDGGDLKFGNNTELTHFKLCGSQNQIYSTSNALELHNTTAGDQSVYHSYYDDSGTRYGYIGYPSNDDMYFKNENAGGQMYSFAPGSYMYWHVGGAYELRLGSSELRPYSNEGLNLGASGAAWNHFYLGQGSTFSSGGYWTLRSRDSDRQVMEYTSSERFKKDIVDLPLNEAYQILDARPIKFRGADDDSSVPLEAGLSAESLHNAGFEYAVRYDEGHWGETPRAIYYEMLTAPLIKICKDQKDRIESLEAKVAALESA